MNYPITPEARHLAAKFLWAERRAGLAMGHRPRPNRGRVYRLVAIDLILEAGHVTRERVRDELYTTADRYVRIGERLRCLEPNPLF